MIFVFRYNVLRVSSDFRIRIMPFLIKFSFTTVFGNIEAKKVLGPDYRNFLDLDCYSHTYIEHNSCC